MGLFAYIKGLALASMPYELFGSGVFSIGAVIVTLTLMYGEGLLRGASDE